MMPAAPTRDTLGPIARTVRDTALLLDVLAGFDPNDPITAYNVGHIPATYTSFLRSDGLTGVRLGVIQEPMSNDTDQGAEDFREIRAAMERALHDMAAGGAEIVDPISIPTLTELLERTNGTFETEEAINAYLAQHPNAPAKTYQEIVLSSLLIPSRRGRMIDGVGHTTDDPGYLQHLKVREELRRAVLQAMADAGLDALAYMTFDHHPTLIPDDVMTCSSRSQPGSNRTLSVMTGFPALTVPAGFAGGLPVAIEFLGRAFAEGTLLQIAHGYEQATLHRRPPDTTPPL